MRRRKARGAGALDAPVSGGQSGAENGTLTVMVGGDESGFRQGQAGDRGLCARRQSDRPVRLGPAHQDGQSDLHRRADRGARRGAAFRARAPASTSRRSSTPSPRARRNPGRWTIAGAPWSRASSISASPSTGCARTSPSASRRRGANGAELPVTALVDQFYAEIQAMGGGRWDTSSLIARLERKTDPLIRKDQRAKSWEERSRKSWRSSSRVVERQRGRVLDLLHGEGRAHVRQLDPG